MWPVLELLKAGEKTATYLTGLPHENYGKGVPRESARGGQKGLKTCRLMLVGK